MEDFISKPDLGESLNNLDQFLKVNWPGGINEYAIEEKAVIIRCLEHLKQNHKLTNIVEIGVDRDMHNQNTQTKTFISNKNNDTKYFGFDIEQRNHVTTYGPNCYFYQNDGGDVSNNIKVLQNNNVNLIDLLFIDGFHSVNQVIKEWAWSKYLNPDGLILLHDTNYHPGPKEVLSKLNPEKWCYKKFCIPPKRCWGISVAWLADSKLNNIIEAWTELV